MSVFLISFFRFFVVGSQVLPELVPTHAQGRDLGRTDPTETGVGAGVSARNSWSVRRARRHDGLTAGEMKSVGGAE